MGISIPQLLIILAILVILFGTKRLRNIGGDLGSAVKGFRKALSTDEEPKEDAQRLDSADAQFKAEHDDKTKQEQKS